MTLDAVCLGKIKRAPLAASAMILVSPPLHCEQKKRYWVEGTCQHQYRVAIHGNCICNEYAALYNRHLIDRVTENYSPISIKFHFVKFLKAHAYLFKPIERCNYTSIFTQYHGAKRAKYVKAAEYLRNDCLASRHYKISMFVKPDRYQEKEIYDKAPRAIQFRSAEFNLELATYLKPIEEYLYESTGNRVFAKGLDSIERGEHLLQKWQRYRDPVAILLDHSKFDSCLTVDLLQRLHVFYRKFNKSKHFSKLLRKQLRNTGYSAHGIKYKINGTGMSGDFDTACKNCIINYFILYTIFGEAAEYFIDGDDSVIICERRFWREVKDQGKLSFCGMAGMTTKYKVVDKINQVEFCQQTLLSTGVMVREPHRAISHMMVSLKLYSGKARLAYLAGKAQGLFHVVQRCPILYVFYEALTRTSRRKIIEDEVRQYMKYKLVGPPTDEDRLAYEQAFGYTYFDQLSIEAELKAAIDSRDIFFKSHNFLKHWNRYYAAPESAEECCQRSTEACVSSGIA